MGIDFRLIWFDSFGAKSSCTLVKTPDLSILIDPGIAVMQPSFPATPEMKAQWVLEGRNAIIKASKKVNCIVISHYHWDHFLPRELNIYEGKVLFVKNPNEYINDSQRDRALNFYSNLWRKFGGGSIGFRKQEKNVFKDVADELRSVRRDFGDYNERRKELLEKGKKWFLKRVDKWRKWKIIPEVKLKDLKIIYPESREFKFGRTKLQFTPPLFHGIEYSRVGWVFSTIVKYGDEKLIHSSDLNGPIIEDYADFIVQKKPTYLILDGPMTYMLGYMFNLINFRRVMDNVKRIIEKVDFKLMIWDHHLPREGRFRKRTKEVWELAKKLKKNLLTAREHEFGEKPVVELLI